MASRVQTMLNTIPGSVLVAEMARLRALGGSATLHFSSHRRLQFHQTGLTAPFSRGAQRQVWSCLFHVKHLAMEMGQQEAHDDSTLRAIPKLQRSLQMIQKRLSEHSGQMERLGNHRGKLPGELPLPARQALRREMRELEDEFPTDHPRVL